MSSRPLRLAQHGLSRPGVGHGPVPHGHQERHLGREVSNRLQTVVEQGGLQPGGLNFDAKVRRESTDREDLFVAHIGAVDAFARGLGSAVRVIEDGLVAGMVKERYSSFSDGIGQKVEDGSATLEDTEAFIERNGEPKVTSGKQEEYETISNHYIQ